MAIGGLAATSLLAISQALGSTPATFDRTVDDDRAFGLAIKTLSGAEPHADIQQVLRRIPGDGRFDLKRGVFDYKFSGETSGADVFAVLNIVRRSADVLWAEIRYAEPKDQRAVLEAEASEQTNHLLVKERASFASVSELVDFLSAAAGIRLTYVRDLWDGTRVLLLPESMSVSDANKIAARLQADAQVEFAEPERRNDASFVPSDPFFSSQWHYGTPTSDNLGGVNLPLAWDVTQGDPSLVVAVVDTGVVSSHPDLAGKLVAGYDFVSAINTSGDGSGRDSDASDPGDSCAGRPSSWHGTHVAGTIGAMTSNGIGTAGVAPNVRIQPVRALGKCGGAVGDIADAIVWAAGEAVPGVPTNATPAKVINLSLGGTGPCPAASQNAINRAIARGATVVVAAGNEARTASQSNPANCLGVITVHAHTRYGDYASYSNFGSAIGISAPGGQMLNTGPRGADGGVLSTFNTGAAAPGTNSYGYMQGTSMAAPHVSGVAALILSRFPSYTAATVKAIFQSSAREFDYASSCSYLANCGPGLLDAYTAVTDRTEMWLYIEGQGTITGTPASVSCSSAPCGFYVSWSPTPTIALTAVPSPGYVFIGWVGACSGTSPCSYTPDRSKSLLARFAPVAGLISLSIGKSGTGSGMVASNPAGITCGATCSYSFAAGSRITLLATSNSDSRFVSWSGACSGTQATCSIPSLTGAMSAIAIFESLDDYADNAAQAFAVAANSSTTGSIYNGADADWFRIFLPSSGTWVIRTSGATDTIGEVFAPDGVTSFGFDDDSGGAFNFAMTFSVPTAQTVLVRVAGYKDLYGAATGPYTLISSFTPGYMLTVNKAGSGAGVVSSSPVGINCGGECAASFDTGTVVTLTAVASTGSIFVGWSGGGCSGVGTCTITMTSTSTVTATFTPAPTANPPRLGNISTRMQVLTGNNVMIAGFVVGGSTPKTLAITAQGPSLIPAGIPNALANPTLQLVRASDGVVIATNDDWQSGPYAAQLSAAHLNPPHALESGIVMTLAPGAYTAIVSGAGGGTGVGLVGVFEIDHPEIPLVNISTRGLVLTGGDVMIGGFIVNGSDPQTVVIHGIGPALAAAGITNALQNPAITLVRASDGAVLATNDDWQSAPNASQIMAAGFAPSNIKESAIMMSLPPGAYTAILQGVGGGTGVGIIAVYTVP